jgi:PAS domain-containing protein
VVVESRQVRVSYDGDLLALETNRDITARKHAEEELRKSEEQLQHAAPSHRKRLPRFFRRLGR